LRRRVSPEKFERMQWDPGLRERRTTTDYLAVALRTAIYDGQFDDGEELNQVELARYFGVSRVPIREALRQLQAEGLVRIIAHHRTAVAGLSLPEIIESVEMRAVLEAHMLRRGASNLGADEMKRLAGLCDDMDRIEDYGARWVLRNWEFHRIIYAAARSQVMTDAVERIHLNVERYARRAGTAVRRREAAAEHGAIVGALGRNEVERAAALLAGHILNTGEAIKACFERASQAVDGPEPARPEPAAGGRSPG
jgi:DNA-binding GntR family transcriptional regulator